MNQDVPHRLHKEHSEWLIAKHTQQQQKLHLQQAFVAQYPDFDEAKELAEQLQNEVAYCENILEYLKKNFNQQSDCNTSQSDPDALLHERKEQASGLNDHAQHLVESASAATFSKPFPRDDEDNDLVFDESEAFVKNESNQRDPMDMLQAEYKGMPMFEIIERILNDNPKALSSEEVTKIAYDTRSEDEFERAKASMSAQLRIGASKRRWVKTDRGVFAANHVAQELQTSGNKSTSIDPTTSPMAEQLLVLSQIQNGKKID